MKAAASVLVSASVAVALATLAAPAHAQGTSAPAPAAKPAAPPAKPAAPPPAKPAAPPAAAAPAKPAAAAPAAAAPAAAGPATATTTAVPAAAGPTAATAPTATHTAGAPAATATATPAGEPAAPGTTVIMMTNAPAAPPPPLCPQPRPLAPLFAPAAFLVRFGAGPGYTWASGDPNTKLTGASGSFDLTMGGFILQDFALHADFGWMDVFDPDFSVDGNVLDSTSVLFQASTFRAGASYYFMPLRAYLSLGVGFAVAALTSYTYANDSSVTLVGREYTKIGPSFAAELGKEFEISPFWAIGAAAHYELLSVPPGDDHTKATIDFAQQVSLRFIATFGDR